MTFSERLKQLRINSPRMQKELAEHLQVTTRTLQRYEEGKTEPNIDTLIKIADFFNVSADYLIGRRDD
jgi:transcriptional regulator with XRE-family HTH domain